MRAKRFYAEPKELAVEDVPIPELDPGEVLVEILFCGICHSDLSLINGTFPSQRAVVTQGHEASGTVAALGLERIAGGITANAGRRYNARFRRFGSGKVARRHRLAGWLRGRWRRH